MNTLLVIAVLLAVRQIVVFRIFKLLLIGLETRMMAALQLHAFRSIMAHSDRFFKDSFAGTLSRKVFKLAEAFESLVDKLMFNLVQQLISTVSIALMLFIVHPGLGFQVTAFALVFGYINYRYCQWKYPIDQDLSNFDSRVSGATVNPIECHTAVKTHGTENEECERYAKALEIHRQKRVYSYRLNELSEGVQSVVGSLLEVGLLYYGFQYWQKGDISAGDYALIMLYTSLLFQRLGDFGRVLRYIMNDTARANEMIEIINLPVEVESKPNARNLEVSEGEVVLNNIGFSYTNNGGVLRGINLRLKPGERVGLVGSTGAGKSTLVSLLLRMYDPTDGEILIDGQNISEVTLTSLARAIAYVPQDPVLFHRTLFENIAYGCPTASRDEVVRAAKLAHCHEFISELPNGYDTYVGERGTKLSGGQRQRVAIARAILKDAPILLLDEATSALDSETEKYIGEALQHLLEGKTVIAVAHRLSTLRDMHRIVVLDQGKVVDEGSHDQLVVRAGIYRDHWLIQAGGFAVESVALQ
jgi:ATP-binding cassette subfamily B protein